MAQERDNPRFYTNNKSGSGYCKICEDKTSFNLIYGQHVFTTTITRMCLLCGELISDTIELLTGKITRDIYDFGEYPPTKKKYLEIITGQKPLEKRNLEETLPKKIGEQIIDGKRCDEDIKFDRIYNRHTVNSTYVKDFCKVCLCTKFYSRLELWPESACGISICSNCKNWKVAIINSKNGVTTYCSDNVKPEFSNENKVE